MAEAHTTLLYQTDGRLTHHTSKLVSLQPVKALPDADQALVKNATDEDFALVTDATIFYVQGGGQPSDTGTIFLLPDQGREEEASIFEVHAARHPAAGHAVLHFGRFNPAPVLVPTGTRIKQSIDIPKRELHSRLHTAGHILGLAINALSADGVLPKLVESKASHYPDSAAVEFIGSIGNESKGAIQKMTDELVAGASRCVFSPVHRILEVKCASWRSTCTRVARNQTVGRRKK